MRQIRIKLNAPESTIGYYRLQEQWENEGGAIRVRHGEEFLPDELIPVKPGEYFRVVDGVVDLIDDSFYYIVNIEKVDAANEVSGSVETHSKQG